MARSVFSLVPLLLVGCVLSRSTALPLDAPSLEAEVRLAIGQSNMEVFADKVPRGADHVEVPQFGHDPHFNIPLWTSLKRAGKFAAVAGEFAATLSRLRRRPVRVIAAAVGGTDLSCWERGGDCYENQLGRLRAASVPIVGVIWWQGETEAITQDPAVIATYATRLKCFFNGCDRTSTLRECRLCWWVCNAIAGTGPRGDRPPTVTSRQTGKRSGRPNMPLSPTCRASPLSM